MSPEPDTAVLNAPAAPAATEMVWAELAVVTVAFD